MGFSSQVYLSSFEMIFQCRVSNTCTVRKCRKNIFKKKNYYQEIIVVRINLNTRRSEVSLGGGGAAWSDIDNCREVHIFAIDKKDIRKSSMCLNFVIL